MWHAVCGGLRHEQIDLVLRMSHSHPFWKRSHAWHWNGLHQAVRVDVFCLRMSRKFLSKQNRWADQIEISKNVADCHSRIMKLTLKRYSPANLNLPKIVLSWIVQLVHVKIGYLFCHFRLAIKCHHFGDVLFG